MKRGTAAYRCTRDMALFAMLGALMFCSKLIMEALPNIHLIGMLIVTYTVVYRVKALIPIYVFVLLTGLYAGFALWWIPYLYIWAVLWAMAMLIPRTIPAGAAVVVYPIVCALHGLAYGTLYAPAQIILFMNGDFGLMFKWIAAGFPWDCIQAAGNLVAGTLIYPASRLLLKLEKVYN